MGMGRNPAQAGSDQRMIGKTIAGRYSLVRLLGDGGMGAVYKAEDNVLRRFVAIKLLHPAAAANPAAVERFLREAQAAASIGHPNIIDILDFGEAEGKPYLVMEYLRGRSLADAIHTDGALNIKMGCSVATHALAGLQAAHDRGILHRDLKPANLMLVVRFGDRSFVKLLDFGFAALLGGTMPSDKSLTPARTLVGTPAYAAPERLRGDDRRDPRTDLYSLGVVLYEMLAGVRPFDAATFSELARKVQNDPPPSLRLYRPDAPEALERVVNKALAKNPEERWPDAEHFAAALVPFGGRVVEVDDAASDSLTMDLIKIRARERKREPAPTGRPAPSVPAEAAEKRKPAVEVNSATLIDDSDSDIMFEKIKLDLDRKPAAPAAVPPNDTKPALPPVVQQPAPAPTAMKKPASMPPPPPAQAAVAAARATAPAAPNAFASTVAARGSAPTPPAQAKKPATVPPPPPPAQVAPARPAAPAAALPEEPLHVETVRTAAPSFAAMPPPAAKAKKVHVPPPAPAPSIPAQSPPAAPLAPAVSAPATAAVPSAAPRGSAGAASALGGASRAPGAPPRRAPAPRAFEGTVGLSILRFVSRRYGERALKTVLEGLPPDARQVFTAGVTTGQWISFGSLCRLVEVIDAKLGRDDLHLIADCGRAVAEGAFDTMKKLGPPTPPPELLLAEMPGFVESLIRGVECKVRSVGRGYGRLELDEFDADASLTTCVIVLGFLDRSLTRFGAREVEVNLLNCRYLGDDENLFDISWLIT
jgi:serine/threonine protein kinase